MKWLSFLVLLLLFSLLCLSSQGDQVPTEPLGTEEIEDELFNLINRERAKRGIHLLEVSGSMIPLARRHSQEMAHRSQLTHTSHDGKTFAQRLQEAGLYFKETGENVAFSQSFLPEAIHNSFMRSDGHRGNILNPRFDKVSIGVFYRADKGYYITQDFLTSLEAKPEKEFREMLEKQINARRSQRGLLPILFLDKLNSLAHKFSLKRAKGEPLPDLPEQYGEILHLFILTPLLELEEKDMERIVDPTTTRAGIGIFFEREEKNPGGTYYISFLLLRKSVFSDMNPDEIRLRLLDEINSYIAEKGDRPVKLDKHLSGEARIIAEKANTFKGKAIAVSPMLNDYQVIPYNTNNPLRLPETIKVKLNYIRIRKIGLGIVPDSEAKEPPQKYWVVILFY